MDWLRLVHKENKLDRPDVRPGDDVRVWFKIREAGKERLAHFEGIVIRVRGNSFEKTFTVRRLTHGEGVERVFPLDARVIDRIEVLRHGRTRRSRLYFLRRVIKRTRLATVEGRPERKNQSVASMAAEPAPEIRSETPPEAENLESQPTASEESVENEVTKS